MNISGCRKHCYWFSHKHFFLVQALYHSHLLYTTVTFQERTGNPGEKKMSCTPSSPCGCQDIGRCHTENIIFSVFTVTDITDLT